MSTSVTKKLLLLIQVAKLLIKKSIIPEVETSRLISPLKYEESDFFADTYEHTRYMEAEDKALKYLQKKGDRKERVRRNKKKAIKKKQQF